MKNERNEVLEQLYEEHYDSVFRLCASIVRNDRRLYPLIEDCVQDAFVKAINIMTNSRIIRILWVGFVLQLQIASKAN